MAIATVRMTLNGAQDKWNHRTPVDVKIKEILDDPDRKHVGFGNLTKRERQKAVNYWSKKKGGDRIVVVGEDGKLVVKSEPTQEHEVLCA